jgi:hypothetical protein
MMVNNNNDNNNSNNNNILSIIALEKANCTVCCAVCIYLSSTYLSPEYLFMNDM